MSKTNTAAKKKPSLLRIIRACVQAAFFIFLPALYISAFADLKFIYQSVMEGTFDVAALLPQVLELAAVVAVTLVLGRFFCGWMCAFGSFGDFIFGIAKKGLHVRFRIDEKADRALKSVKYGLLALAVVFLWTYNVPGLSSASPWDVFGMLATVGTAPNLSLIFSNLMPGFIFFILISVGSAFVQRFFCRYLCPLGAVFAILSALRISRVIKPARNCGKCRVCTQSCAMGISLYKMEFVHSGECIECLQCISSCPRQNVSLRVAGQDARPLVAGAVAAIAITGLWGTSGAALAKTDESAIAVASQSSAIPSLQEDLFDSSALIQPEATLTPAVTNGTQADSVQTSAYKNGTYTGTGYGFRGQTKVSVTIQNGEVTDVVTVSTQDDQKWYQRAFSTIANRIVSSQSADVNAVSGATYSSQGIMEAVANALDQAAA